MSKEKDIPEEDLFLKPKKFRNRRSKPKVEVHERAHPVHTPYKRSPANLLLEDAWDEAYGVLGHDEDYKPD